MSKVAPALRLLCAITFASAMTPAFAAWKEHPENSWKYYLANCQRMQEKMADVQSGRVPGAFEVMGDLENSQGSMNEHRPNLPPQYLASGEFAQCENVAAEADAMIARGKAEFADRMNQAAEQGRIAHQNSPEYQRARSLGYSDVGGKPDTVQIMLNRGHLYVGHMFTDGVTVLDVSNPREPPWRWFTPSLAETSYSRP